MELSAHRRENGCLLVEQWKTQLIEKEKSRQLTVYLPREIHTIVLFK